MSKSTVSSDVGPTGNGGTTRTGGCLCGAVRYEIDGDPVMSGFCFCKSCQKLTGTGHSFLAVVPEAAFRATGETSSFTWTADSGNPVTTSFCPICGSPLFGRTSGFPGMVSFRVASLDDSSDLAPRMAVFASRRQPWDHLVDGLTAFPEMPPPQPA